MTTANAMNAANAVTVHPSNAEQLRAWDGDEGAYWAAHADHYDRAVAAHHRRLLEAAAIGATDRVLDVGCGTGQTTRDAARAARAGTASGVDLSAAMLDHARRLAAVEGLTNIAFEQADAQIHPFETGAFDVAISRTGVMFFGDVVAGLANVGRALRREGRLVLTTWQPVEQNEWIRELAGALAAGRALPAPSPDAPGPFSLSDPERIRTVLSRAGFADIGLDGAHAAMWFGRDADEAYDFVLGQLGWMLEGLDDGGRGRALDALRATVAAHATADGVLYGSAAWTITATRS
jgi:SAM-dependent methyltransferase